jgi:hypothetical protein
LIPSRQFQHFLVIINNTLETHLKLPDNTTDSKLFFEFPKDGTPRPRYLGHTNEREMAECLKKAIPSSSYRPDGEVEEKCKPSEKSLEAFKKKIELLLESDGQKKGLIKEKKKLERFAKQRAWNHEIKRVQRYLGLRQAGHGNNGAYKAAGASLKNSSLGKYDSYRPSCKSSFDYCLYMPISHSSLGESCSCNRMETRASIFSL